jgi:hypothetical protein
MAAERPQATIFVLDNSASMSLWITPPAEKVSTKALTSGLKRFGGKKINMVAKAVDSATDVTLWEALVTAVKAATSSPVVTEADLLGGMVFASETRCLLEIQDRTKEAIDQFLTELDATKANGGGTALYSALAAVMDRAETYDADFNLVVVTDGMDNMSTEQDIERCSELSQSLVTDGRLNLAFLAILPEDKHDTMRTQVQDKLGVPAENIRILDRDRLSLKKLLDAMKKTLEIITNKLRR